VIQVVNDQFSSSNLKRGELVLLRKMEKRRTDGKETIDEGKIMD